MADSADESNHNRAQGVAADRAIAVVERAYRNVCRSIVDRAAKGEGLDPMEWPDFVDEMYHQSLTARVEAERGDNNTAAATLTTAAVVMLLQLANELPAEDDDLPGGCV